MRFATASATLAPKPAPLRVRLEQAQRDIAGAVTELRSGVYRPASLDLARSVAAEGVRELTVRRDHEGAAIALRAVGQLTSAATNISSAADFATKGDVRIEHALRDLAVSDLQRTAQWFAQLAARV